MNKNDFYKQLMSEYSFDCEKIRSNARKGRYAKQRAIPMYIGMTAAAAALVVAVGTTVFTAVRSGDPVERGVVLSGSGDAVLTPNERFINALNELQKNAESNELRDVMVTFSAPLAPADAKAVLTAYTEESIPVKKLYFTDGTEASGKEQVEEGFGSGRQISGAVVNCAGYVMASLTNDSRVLIAENYSADMTAPIDTNAVDSNIVSVPENPSVPDNSVPILPGGESADSSSEPETSGADRPDIESGESSDGSQTFDTTDTSDSESFETSAPVSEETTDDGSAEPPESADAPEVTSPEPPQTVPDTGTSAPQEPDVPVVTQPEKLPDGVTLPESVDRFLYETINLGAKEAFFMSERTFFVRTPYQVQMYAFNGFEEKLLAAEDCDDAEICWISENGDSLIVSAIGDNGMRSRLLYVDANGERITDLNAADTVMDGTLKGVGYNADSGLLVMNILENGKYYVCAESFGGNGEPDCLPISFESASPVKLMAAEGMKIYFSVNDGALAQIYELNAENGNSRLIKTYENNPVISSNLAFTHGIISPSSAAITGKVEIFDPRTLTFAAVGGADAAVDFGTNKHSFMTGGSCYTVSGGSISAAGGTAVLGRVDYRKSASTLYSAAVSGGKVRIRNSIYSAKARSGGLTFGELSDSASAEIRAAVNGAIAVNNLIAQGSYEKCGVATAQELSQCVDMYYSASAANALRSRCGISPMGGALKYNGAGLVSANVYDTVLSVSESGGTASGILYVKTGNYGGKAGYVSYSVKLINENGLWKVDCLLAN